MFSCEKVQVLQFVNCKESTMALHICLSLSGRNHSHLNTKFSSHQWLISMPIIKPSPPLLPTSLKFNPHSRNTTLQSLCLTKRELSLSLLALISSSFSPNLSSSALAQELVLQNYTDSKEGFTLLVPSSWIKVDKAGSTVLFEEPNKGINNVGVVVSPVRLKNLGEFGTPQFVADKLIQAEKRKESTKDAEVIGVAERSGQGDLQVYEFEYKVNSTRGGMKRIYSAAFVASQKLYLLNVTHSDKPESPLDSHTKTALEEVLHSFDVAPTT